MSIELVKKTIKIMEVACKFSDKYVDSMNWVTLQRACQQNVRVSRSSSMKRDTFRGIEQQRKHSSVSELYSLVSSLGYVSNLPV